MFLHLFKYKLLDIVRQKDEFFWCGLFPIILGTLFYFGFGGLMNGNDSRFTAIPVAVVKEEANETFETVLNEVGCYENSDSSDNTNNSTNNNTDNSTKNSTGDNTDKDDALFVMTECDLETANQLLSDGEVDAIIHIKEEPEVSLSKSEFNATIVVSFMNQYLTTAKVITETIKNNPAAINDVLNAFSSETVYNTEKKLTDTSYDPYVQYFYALIAMSCIFCAMAGTRCASSLQANMSPLGMRREASAAHKLPVIMADFAATLFMQCIYFVILIAYLSLVLGIDFGERVPFVLLTGFVGNIIGISMGLFIGCALKKDLDFKISVATSFSMALCFLSGLMINNIKDLIEHNCPIVNRLNPAALITDCLYALNMYEDFSRYTVNIVTMLVIAVLLCIGSYILLRRTRYANL